MDPIQAKLRVRLFADEVQVAESSDPELWQKVLSAILTGQSLKEAPGHTTPKGNAAQVRNPKLDELDASDPVSRMAGKIEVPRAELVGALGPASEPPYLHLDPRTWEAFKSNFPERGSNAVAAVVFAATALVVWLEELGQEPPTTAQAQAVLGTINVTGKNPGRSIRNCEWLQDRSGRVQLNPARISQAYAVLRAFCLRQGPSS